MVWLRTCLYPCVNLTVAFTLQPAAMPPRTATTATLSRPAAAAPSENGCTSPSKDAASSFSQSVFNQIVTQIVDESATPVPAARAQIVKLPPRPVAASEDPLPELSSPAPAVLAKAAENVVGGRKQDMHGP